MNRRTFIQAVLLWWAAACGPKISLPPARLAAELPAEPAPQEATGFQIPFTVPVMFGAWVQPEPEPTPTPTPTATATDTPTPTPTPAPTYKLWLPLVEK